MYRFPPSPMPNDVQWNRHRAPDSTHWGPFDRPRAPFLPRNQGFYNQRPPMHGSSEEYWCETCDRGFPNEDLLSNHKQQHQKCSIDGCQFIAHPKVITKHIQMQHSSGLYKKISKLNNPEEIEKWRQERKKKYPTKINVDKKAAELKEKIDRGEKMNLGRKDWHSKKGTNYQNRDINSGQGVKRPYNNANNNHPAPKFRKPRKQIPKILPVVEETRSLTPFAGIQHLVIESDEEVNESLDCDDLIKDDEIGTIGNDLRPIDNDKSAIVEEPLVVCSALSSLMCEYASSNEETDDIEFTKKELKGKEISKLDRTDNSESKGKEQRTLQTCSTDLPQKDKTTNKIGKSANEDVEKQQRQQNNITGVGAESYAVLPIINNPDSKVDVVKNNVADTSDSRPGLKVPKNENESKNDASSKSEDKNDKLDSSKKNDGIIDQDDNDSGPEEVNIDKSNKLSQENNPDNIAQENNADNNILRKKAEVLKRKPVYRKPQPKLPSTLIYRLILSKEMKQERNQVLQCIRYIRKNNYFDKSST